MNLQRIQSWMITYLFPAILFFLGTVFIIVLFGKAYFWDISTLTVRFSGDMAVQVTLKTKVRLFYEDVHFFGFRYPIHIILPRTQTKKCTWECIFPDVSPGEVEIMIAGNPSQFARVFVAPDTRGIIDLRPPIIFKAELILPYTLPEKISDNVSPLFSNTVQGLFLFRDHSFYDHSLRQIVRLLPQHDCQKIFLWIKQHEYYCVSDDHILLLDRYGKNTTTIAEVQHDNMKFSWQEENTTFSLWERTRILSGYWFPWIQEGYHGITDGKEVFSWGEN